jgi:hypothetical protein
MNPKPKSKKDLQGVSIGKRRGLAVRRLKKLPKFKNEKEEFKFWATQNVGGMLMKIDTFLTRLGIERNEKKQKLDRRVL